MKTNSLLVIAASLIFAASSNAQVDEIPLRTGKTTVKEVVEVQPDCKFRDNEFQFDVFGLGDFYKGANGNFAGGEGTSSRQFSGRPSWGGGVGLNYFFARYVGIGLEQSMYGRNIVANQSTPPDRANYGFYRWATIGNLYLRYPVCQWNLAPYLMVGGGANYGLRPNATVTVQSGARQRYRMAGQGFGHVGGGLEYRITENIGLFSDARYLFSGVDGLPDAQLMWRYGLRLAF
jgi:hypothetical protein